LQFHDYTPYDVKVVIDCSAKLTAAISKQGLQALQRCDPDLQVAVHATVLLWTAAHNIRVFHCPTGDGSQTFFKVHQPQRSDKSKKQHCLSRDILLVLHGALVRAAAMFMQFLKPCNHNVQQHVSKHCAFESM
jgi:hypothetical protein